MFRTFGVPVRFSGVFRARCPAVFPACFVRFFRLFQTAVSGGSRPHPGPPEAETCGGSQKACCTAGR
eukprot:4760298-Lingulodinium_polyedra.AAC.1